MLTTDVMKKYSYASVITTHSKKNSIQIYP